MFDIAVIGGGAAGLCSAITAKDTNPSLKIAVFEANSRVGKKLSVTGNGRCNITNKNITLQRYRSNNGSFFEFALNSYNLSKTEEFFDNLGVPFVFEGDKAFPAALQAASVVDALRFECDALGIELLTDSKIENLEKTNGIFTLFCNGKKYSAKTVIAAFGGMAGLNKFGADSKNYDLLLNFGHSLIKTKPSIVQLKTEPQIVRQLKGIKVDCKVCAICNGKTLQSDFGEVLFCDYGLSGPPILQLSHLYNTNKKLEISLDLASAYTHEQLFYICKNRQSTLTHRPAGEFFTGFLNKRVGQVILKLSGVNINDDISAIKYDNIKKSVSLIKDFKFIVTGTTGLQNAQVTSGGIDTKDFYPDTLESKKVSGLFAAGELLDVDGDCGGFNLQWAWSSGMLAAHSAVRFIKGDK